MGLHHDGELLGLGPFESEMRRRLWWQIVNIDAKYAMLTGLSHSLLPRSWNIQEPKNLNDADLFPTATEPFQDREGPTEMIFCLMNNKISKFLVESPGLEVMIMLIELGEFRLFESMQIQDFRRTIERLASDLLSLLDKYCDPSAGPVHGMAIEIKALMMDKLNQLVTPPEDQPDWEGDIQSPKDNAFRIAVSALELDERTYMATKDKGFIWYWMIHFQIDVFIYLAGQLCHRTEGRLVERAWKQVEIVYRHHPDLLDTSSKTSDMLARFILKAWTKREAALQRQTGMVPETPAYIEALRSCTFCEDMKYEPTPPQRLAPDLAAGAQNLTVSDPALDQLLSSYFDASTFDWSMVGPMQNNNNNQSGPPFRFGMGL